MENKEIFNQIESEEPAIDFGILFSSLLKYKRLFYKVLGMTFVLACIIAFSIPEYYKCEVTLAPELFNIPVHKKDSTRMIPYYDYLIKEQKKPWWSYVFSAPFKLIGLLMPKSDSIIDQHQVNPFMLTKQQTSVVGLINKNVICDVDAKTYVISIEVTDQDPLIAATIADSVKVRLQNFITDYRTKKVKVDLEYNKKLFKEAKERYEKARQLYAEFMDSNQDIILQTVRQKQTDLENEMQLQYNAYTQVASQLLAAEAKVQQETPAFTTLQSATVPVLKEGPKRAQMCLIFLFLAFLGTTAFILYKEDDLKPLLGMD